MHSQICKILHSNCFIGSWLEALNQLVQNKTAWKIKIQQADLYMICNAPSFFRQRAATHALCYMGCANVFKF